MQPADQAPPATRYSKTARVFRKLHKERAKIPLSSKLRTYSWALRMMKKPYFKEWEEMPQREWNVIADDDADDDDSHDGTWDKPFGTKASDKRDRASFISIHSHSESESSSSTPTPPIAKKPGRPRKHTAASPKKRGRKRAILNDDSSSSTSAQTAVKQESVSLLDQKIENTNMLDIKPHITPDPSAVALFDDPSSSTTETTETSSDSSASDDIPFRIG